MLAIRFFIIIANFIAVVKCFFTSFIPKNGKSVAVKRYAIQPKFTMNLIGQVSLSTRIRNAVELKFSNQKKEISRVIKCWDDFVGERILDRYLDDKQEIRQIANCFVEGLTATCFHSMDQYKWSGGLESGYKTILSELVEYERRHLSTPISNQAMNAEGVFNTCEVNSGGEWLGPRDTSGTHYGPTWKTLGLQDRSVWSAELSPEFPQTISLLQDLKVPSCEVFFAKQGPNSGIKPHSDRNNFILTCHLALSIPGENACWIRVGNETHYWKDGSTCVFDTSIVHSTENTSDRTRYVLLIRFWHPELTELEREAFKFIFAFLDHASQGDDAADQFELLHILTGKDNHSGLQTTLTTKPSNPKKTKEKVSLNKKASLPAARGFGAKK